MDTKSISSRQVYWAQKLSCYYFQIDYCQGKANEAADTFSRFPQRSLDKEEKFWAENTQIFYCLQTPLRNASLIGFSLPRLNVAASSNLSPLHQVLTCGTHSLPQLRQFWDIFYLLLGIKAPTRSVLVACGSGYKNCRKPTLRPKN